MNIIQRLNAPTPKFFRVVRNVGLVLTAASTVVLTAPISLPPIVISIAGYVALAGAVASAISQAAVNNEDQVLRLLDDNGGGTHTDPITR